MAFPGLGGEEEGSRGGNLVSPIEEETTENISGSAGGQVREEGDRKRFLSENGHFSVSSSVKTGTQQMTSLVHTSYPSILILKVQM